MSEQVHSEEVLGGRLLVNVGTRWGSPVVYLGSLGNKAGSMKLTPLELAALLDGPLQRALDRVNAASTVPTGGETT